MRVEKYQKNTIYVNACTLIHFQKQDSRLEHLGCRSSLLHAKEVSWKYQSGNKYKKFDNQVMNDFMDVLIGKQNMKIMKNNVFWHKKLSKSRRLIHLCKNMIISFCNTFLQNLSRVMRHIKTKQFKEKIKNCQNHEGSCIYGYIFWYPKKLLLLSIEKRHQFWTLLESGIGGLILKH